MASYTLLGVVNSYLTATDNHTVSSINDLIESEQVADIAEQVFDEVQVDAFNSSIARNILRLESVSDSTKPNYLKIPDEVINIRESKIRYNSSRGLATESSLKYRQVKFLHPEDFLDKINCRSTLNDNSVVVEDFSGVQMIIRTNKAPTYCTSFDDKYIVFDSHDITVDTTLQTIKSQIVAGVTSQFIKQDGWVIDLPEWFHPHYAQLVRSRASEYLRGEPLITDLRKGEAGLIKARNKQRVGNSKFQKKRYGRR